MARVHRASATNAPQPSRLPVGQARRDRARSTTLACSPMSRQPRGRVPRVQIGASAVAAARFARTAINDIHVRRAAAPPCKSAIVRIVVAARWPMATAEPGSGGGGGGGGGAQQQVALSIVKPHRAQVEPCRGGERSSCRQVDEWQACKGLCLRGGRGSNVATAASGRSC